MCISFSFLLFYSKHVEAIWSFYKSNSKRIHETDIKGIGIFAFKWYYSSVRLAIFIAPQK